MLPNSCESGYDRSISDNLSNLESILMPDRLEKAGEFPSLLETYRDGLLNDTLPFWIQNGVDMEHGGFITSLDRDGSVIDTGKGVWQQGALSELGFSALQEAHQGNKGLSAFQLLHRNR